MLLNDPAVAGTARAGFWMIVMACWLSAALCVMNLASARQLQGDRQRIVNLLVPLLFGLTVFYLWEVGVRGFGVPPVLLPAPSAAGAKFFNSLPTLAEDFTQTFIRGVLIGYAIGCGAGLLVALTLLSGLITDKVIGRPLEVLAGAMRDVEGGDLSRRVPVETVDEVGRLSQGFNRMLERLSQADAQIRAFNQRLAGEIEAATRDLSEKNATLAQLHSQRSRTSLPSPRRRSSV